VASLVATTFRETVVVGLEPDWADLVKAAVGGGPEQRELSRALMLGDRAARDWAGLAIAKARPGAPNHFEELGQLGKPEDAYHDLQPAAQRERQAADLPETRAVAQSVYTLAMVLPELDTEASYEVTRPELEAVARAAANVLLQAGVVLGGDEWVVEQTNQTLHDLAGLSGWQNQLGPGFA
jgi:hypothetical protein